MPITFNFLIQPWEFEYRELPKKDKPQMIIMAHTKEDFIQELKKYNLYGEYYFFNKETNGLLDS